MAISSSKFFLFYCALFYYYQTVFTDNAEDFLETLREQLRRLEATGKITRDYEPYTEPELVDGETYDFIIVGSGSAGSALAHRLSEVTDWNILLLEAGGEPDTICDVPTFSPLLHFTERNWKFYTEKQENFGLGLQNERMHWPRGKLIGGSSQLNYLLYFRGAKEDYDLWARSGNPGWSYEDLLPLLKRMETCKIDGADENIRGNRGPLSVEKVHTESGGEMFIEAARNAGYKYVDYNGEEHIGVSYLQAALSKGLRCSGERCYLRPIKNRPNLTIRLNSQVTKLLIKDKAAYGLEFESNGKIYKAFSGKEVILSAGVIGSAQILLLSGIGPINQLSTFGIETIQDLPVGTKLYDHQAFLGLGFTINQSISYNIDELLSDEAFVRLFNEGKGILTSLGKAESVLFMRTPIAPDDDRADVEAVFISTHPCVNFEMGVAHIFSISGTMYESLCGPYENLTMISSVLILLHPESHGRLELASASYKVHPKLYPGYFTDPRGNDMRTMIAGIREAIRVYTSPPFDKFGIKLMDNPISGCERFEFDTDEYWECAVRHVTSTSFHPTTTCKMGPADDPEAVVDNRLRVYDVKNLRVADAAAIPIPLTGHTNAPAFLVGEKLGDMLKEEYLE